MKLFALDTSGPNCSVGIYEDTKRLGEFILNNGVTHSQNLVPMIEQLEHFTGVALQEIDAFACSIGPGSFTGLRIGLATIKGFAFSLQKPVIAVPTLQAIASNVSHFDGILCAILDARNDNVYAACYQMQQGKLIQLGDYVSDSISVLLQALEQYPHTPIRFVGDGAVTYRDKIEAHFSNQSEFQGNLSFATEEQHLPTASSVARIAFSMAERQEFIDCHTLSPLYLKKSQAEREQEKQQSEQEKGDVK